MKKILPLLTLLIGCQTVYEQPKIKKPRIIKKNNLEDTIAVLVHSRIHPDSDNSIRSLFRTYSALRDRGVPPKNIYILYGAGRAPLFTAFPDLAYESGLFFNEYRERFPVLPATKAVFTKFMSELQKRVDSKDYLILSFLGHGMAVDNTGFFAFEKDPREEKIRIKDILSEMELRDVLHGFDCKARLALITCCYSGAFADKTSQYVQNTAIIASCKKNHTHLVSPDETMNDVLINSFTPENDFDGDGLVTLDEAYLAAKDYMLERAGIYQLIEPFPPESDQTSQLWHNKFPADFTLRKIASNTGFRYPHRGQR